MVLQPAVAGRVNVHNWGFLKRYAPDYYKLSVHRTYRMPGWEERGGGKPEEKREIDKTKDKLPESISRTRAKIFELAMCNPWEYFVTLTLDKARQDRYDLDLYRKRLSKFLNNLNYQKGLDIQYLLVPERHQDGAWHIHGFFMGLPREYLRPFSLEEDISRKMRKKIKQLLRDGRRLFDFPLYRVAFGFVSVEPIRRQEHCAKYVSKYISKQARFTPTKAYDHMYYCSTGLKRAEVVHQGTVVRDFSPDYDSGQNFVKTKVVQAVGEGLVYFSNAVKGAPVLWPKPETSESERYLEARQRAENEAWARLREAYREWERHKGEGRPEADEALGRARAMYRKRMKAACFAKP